MVVLVVAVVDTPVEVASMVVVFAAATSPVEQDSVVVRLMEEWAISSNVTMQIGIATGTGGMSISFAIGSLFLTTASGLGLLALEAKIRACDELS